MSFKFNFYNSEEETKDEVIENNVEIIEVSEKENSCGAEAASAEHPVTHTQLTDSAEWLSVTLTADSESADKVGYHGELFYLKNATFGGIAALISTTDLIPNVYEGGFQVWECTIDLLHYMVNNPALVSSECNIKSVSSECNIKSVRSECNNRVLDLGCGAGLLGILACKMGQGEGVTCDFQDFNADVIKNFTIPNYLKNSSDKAESVSSECNTLSSVSSECNTLSSVSSECNNLLSVSSECNTLSSVSSRFFSGDWSFVSSRFSQYSLILSSETIYNTTSQGKILAILRQCLATNSASGGGGVANSASGGGGVANSASGGGGVALIASKRHYFGVGGGVLDFMELVAQSNSGLVAQVVWSSSENDTKSGLARDIIMITRS